jgi:hypothetical protein
MERNQERRDEHEKRVPIRAAVELAESNDDAFEADAVNLSRGGMSLRSQCLPDVGAKLWCRFEHPPSGSVIEAEGEVVWAQLEGDASGEIGLAFTDLDPKTELLIEQIIAEHGSPTFAGAVIDPGERDRAAAELDAEAERKEAAQERPSHAPSPFRNSEDRPLSTPPLMPSTRVANLSLEGISEPLSARVAELSAGHAVFEQVLPLLKLGRLVSADAPELLGRRGAISGVELRMMGHVPTLAVIVQFEDGESAALPVNGGYGEASFSSTDVPAIDESLAHDTEPDLDAPSDESQHGAEVAPAAQRVTAAEFSRSPVATTSKPRQLVLDVAPAEAPRVVSGEKEHDEPVPAALASSAGAQAQARPVNHRLDATQVVELEARADGDADEGPYSDRDPFAPEPPAWKPLALAAMRALYALGGMLKVAGAKAAALLGATGVAALPRVRMLLVKGRAVARQATIVIAPKLGAARRMAAAQLGKKRRRTTAGGQAVARDSNDSGSLVRTIGLGILVTAIAGLGVYAVLPTAEPELELHRAVAAPQGEAGLSGEVAAAEPAAAQALDLAQPAAEPPLPMPNAATVPAGSAFAVDVRDQKRAKPLAAQPAAPKAAQAAPQAEPAATKPAPRAMRFGASSVPSKAQTFALRMSKPIQSINGLADAGGFTIIVNGSLSLDRAGPISASHRGVARAMVLNKGDRAELTIRFADGKRPTYQVRADGQTLYVVIEDV